MARSQALFTILRVGLLCIVGVGLSCLSLGVHAQTAGIEVQSNKGEPLRAEISESQAPPPTHTISAESSAGMLNLNRLIEAPHKNAYLWAALTLLGVLAVWAGLRIQIRKTSKALSTLIPSEDMRQSASIAPQSAMTKLPANITALDLNLDLTPQASNKLSGVRSTASTETLQ